MAAVFGRPSLRRKLTAPANHYVTDKGTRYRICVSSNGHGRILFVAFKHGSGAETVLEPNGKRYREIVIAAGLGDKLK